MTKLNGRIRLTSASDKWEIALIGNNITDVDDDLIWGNDTPLVEGSIEATIAQGASYTVSALYKF